MAMRIDMGAAVADGVAEGLGAYGQWSRGGFGGGPPPKGPVVAAMAAHLMQVFHDTDSRAFVTIDTPYAQPLAAAGASAVLEGEAADLVVWNHRELPRGAMEVLSGWDEAAVAAAVRRLHTLNRACGPEGGGTVRYAELVILAADALPPQDAVRAVVRDALGADPGADHLRLHRRGPVAWDEGRAAVALVVELLTDDAPTPCQIAQEETGVAHR